MSPRLVLQFLGLPQLHLDDQPVATDRRKTIALLAYLAVNDLEHGGQRYSREALSALLWPEYEQARAFANLRHTLWEVNQALGEGWLTTERESICLNTEAGIDLDVARFQALLTQSRSQDDTRDRIPLLVEATRLYRNHFLTGFSLKDAYGFNEWSYAVSADLQGKLAGALEKLLSSPARLANDPDPNEAPANASIDAEPSAPALMSAPAPRRGARERPSAIGSAASTIEWPGMPSRSLTNPDSAAAAAPHPRSSATSRTEIRRG